MKSVCAILLLLNVFCVSAQDTIPANSIDTNQTIHTIKTGPKDTADKILTFVEIMPVFPGGATAFTDYLQKNIKYPKKERKAGKEGTVYVKFIVMKDGSIDSVRVVKGVEGAPGLSAEAIRVIKAMPKWTPGTMNGRPVRVEITLPLKFTLSND